jgi:predicted CXXCH cytochrome family protein
VPALLVDTGYFLADERTAHGTLRGDQRVKNDLILRAYDRYPVDVANLSAQDLVYVSELLKGDQKEAAALPIVKRMVSANTTPDSPSSVTPPPFLVREIPVSSEAVKTSKPIRVAFVGLAETGGQAIHGLKIVDPIEAAKRVVPQARQVADLVIVLAHGKLIDMIRIGREVPGIDVLLAGTGDLFTPPMRFGETLVAFTPYEARFLGEIRFYRDAQGKFSARSRFISLDAGVGDDESAMKVAADVTEAQLTAFKANQNVLSQWIEAARTPKAGSSNGGYASSTACAQCHSSQYFKWANGGHARASDNLSLRRAEFDVSCLSCHASGMEKTSSPGQGELPKLLNVQCESCHGPGEQHVSKPAKGYGVVRNMKVLCSGCHTAQTSPHFDLQKYWLKIKH